MQKEETLMKRTDEQIKTDIVNRLRWDSRVDVSDVLIEVKEGCVTLTGTLPNSRAKIIAFDQTCSIRGVIRVDNKLKVVYPSDFAVPSDEMIKLNAENVLDWNPGICDSKLQISVDAGIVTIKGTVAWYWQRDKAEELVSDLSGVLGVKNEVAVVPTEKVVDETIAKDIVEELERSIVNPDSVKVKVANGVVTLGGIVSNYADEKRAYNAAANTIGVAKVVNKLSILIE
jgi:osmotically-inducible protein OsmY